MCAYGPGKGCGRLSLVVLLFLAGCGGGGGGGGAPAPVALVYSGNSSPAIVSTTNASQITAGILGSQNAATVIGGLSTDGGNATPGRGSGLVDLSLRLGREARNAAARAQRASSAPRPAGGVIPIDDTEPCSGGGSVRVFGQLNDNATGSVNISFMNCTEDGQTLNGPGTMVISIFDFGIPAPTLFTISFTRLTVRGAAVSVDATGSVQVQLVLPSTALVTANLIQLDNNTGRMSKTVDLFVSTTGTGPFTVLMTGRVFDQTHGFVDITTPVALSFATGAQLFPDSGTVLLAGNGTGVVVTALSSTMVQLQPDTDGNGTGDGFMARMKWTELSGPIGADIADTPDGDGMHNSWETFYGLSPTVDDSTGNPDGDGRNNLQEYMAGTNPIVND
jgi:hypothetical protein